MTEPSPPTMSEILEHAISRAKPGVLTWAIDDSEVSIEGIPHTILAGLSFHRPATAIAGMAALRAHLQMGDDFEFKWNSKMSNRRQREVASEAFLGILGRSDGVVTIVEGRDKQTAAELVANQIADFHDPQTIPLLIFDEGIVSDPRRFRRYLLDSADERLRFAQFVDARSDLNDLVQCADLLAGFHALKTRIALGYVEDRIITDEEGELPLSSTIEFSLRYSIWGERKHVDFDWNTDESPPPEIWDKHARGLGLRIHSSIAAEIQERIYDGVGIFYMGCLH